MESRKSFSASYTSIDSCVLLSGEPIPRQALYGPCNCSSNCISESCNCVASHGCAYQQDGVLKDFYLNEESVINPVIECSSFCSCNKDSCLNRRTQAGTLPSLYIHNTPLKGNGLYTSKQIIKGTFVCEYIGQVIKIPEYERRLNNDKSMVCYSIKIKEHSGAKNIVTTCIDASYYGNISRFINHSCTPNMVVVPVRSDSVVPRICLFSSVTINEGEELCFSYCDTSSCSTVTLGNVVCHCGSRNCMGFLPLQV